MTDQQYMEKMNAEIWTEIEEDYMTKSRLREEMHELIADFLSKADPIVMDIIYHCIDKMGKVDTDPEENKKCLNQLNDILKQNIDFSAEHLAYINGHLETYLLFAITMNILYPYDYSTLGLD